jgi:hypothetical protein
MRLRFGARRSAVLFSWTWSPRAARARCTRASECGRRWPPVSQETALGLAAWDVSLAMCPSKAMTSRVHKLPCSRAHAAASMQAAAGQRACALPPVASAPRSLRGTTLPVPCRRAAARCARVVQASAALKPSAVAVAAGVAAATLATAQARLRDLRAPLSRCAWPSARAAADAVCV